MEPDTNHAEDVHHGTGMLASGGRFLFFMLTILICLHQAYSSSCQRRHHHDGGTRRLFPRVSPTAQTKGLDPSLFKYLPTFTYSSAVHPPLNDCAICLSELEEGEEARLLSNCNHSFHSHCIDAWFRAHSICPMCRSLVKPSKILKQTSVSSDKFARPSNLPPAITCHRQGSEAMEKTSIVIEPGDDERHLRWTMPSELDLLRSNTIQIH